MFDFVVFLERNRMVLFDSDLLFFAEPTIYLQRIEDSSYLRNTFNADVGDAYTVEPEVVGPLIGHPLQLRVNSELGLEHRGSIC
jgi:hypothetical protein